MVNIKDSKAHQPGFSNLHNRCKEQIYKLLIKLQYFKINTHTHTHSLSLTRMPEPPYIHTHELLLGIQQDRDSNIVQVEVFL